MKFHYYLIKSIKVHAHNHIHVPVHTIYKIPGTSKLSNMKTVSSHKFQQIYKFVCIITLAGYILGPLRKG